MGVTIYRADGNTQVIRLHGEVARSLAEYFTDTDIYELVQAKAASL